LANEHKTRIVIADDHAVVRAGLRALIDGQTDMQVVGEAGDASAAVAQVCDLKPDVVVLDISMGGGGGLKAQEKISAAMPGTKILFLSMHSDPAFVRTAISAGAAGYITKKAVHTELLNALRTVRMGRRYLDPSASEGIFPPTRDKRAILSTREQEALRLLAAGYTNQEIAARLFVSVKTVETYRARIMEKLEAKSRAELVRYAINACFLDGELD
jgi:two-component system, NarL family, response regulator NreC